MSATATVNAFFAALARGAWADAAAMVEPTCAAAFREHELANLIAGARFIELRRGPGPHPSGFGSDGVLRPEELARYGSVKAPGFPANVTIESLARLSPTEFLTRHFELAGGHRRFRPGTAEAPVEIPLRVLGEVPFGIDQAYVVYLYDETADPEPDDERVDPVAGAPHAETVPVHRRDGRWYLGLNIDLRMTHSHATMRELFGDEDQDSPV